MLSIIGTGLLFIEAITPDKVIDFVLMGIGAALVGIYCMISWDWFNNSFGKNANEVLFSPPLLTFGVLAIYYGLIQDWLAPPHDKIFSGIGLAFVLISIYYIQKVLRR